MMFLSCIGLQVSPEQWSVVSVIIGGGFRGAYKMWAPVVCGYTGCSNSELSQIGTQYNKPLYKGHHLGPIYTYPDTLVNIYF